MIPASLHVQLVKAKGAAEAAGLAKREFLASLSHDVRTAMQSIIGMTDAVLATELKPEQRGDLTTVRDSASSLLSLIEDAIDYFKIAER